VTFRRAYYSDTVEGFLDSASDAVLGQLARGGSFSIDPTQRDAWLEQIDVLRSALSPYRDCGKIYFEFDVPRMGRRIDVVAIIRHVVFVIEFKVGERHFTAGAVDQVLDYALDLKNFHLTTHDKPVCPIVVATRAKPVAFQVGTTAHNDSILVPLRVAPSDLSLAISQALEFCDGPAIDPFQWEQGHYSPTPTIIEAALALYGGHQVSDISRSDAGAINLTETTQSITAVIDAAKTRSHKAICFVTGVPGAGKTLVGLNVATQHIDKDSATHSVFLSGNGPLVKILCEALARDKVRRELQAGRGMKLGPARSEVKAFVQNVHHFRDECLRDADSPPHEHVALFDEAQRAWNRDQTEKFMRQKKSRPDFKWSEAEFLISCMDRHRDWAVVVCLVGGGQEINTGEAGIGEWIEAVLRSFPDWHVHVSPQLRDSEYAAGEVLQKLEGRPLVHLDKTLHLGVSMRSFRAESISAFVKHLLDRDHDQARRTLSKISARYPLVLTRNLNRAKEWLKAQARGSERYGIVVSSQAQRLKPHAIDVRSPMDPVHWFLDGKEDVRSSYYLEDVATEFDVQGLELDWSCVVWDADFRYADSGWHHHSFVGSKWHTIRKQDNQAYLKNAYRVLLTRARQGMVIVVPEGAADDPTRIAAHYDPTFEYLHGLGLPII
jgi:hypothetical protein